jgi:glutaredoxin
MDIPKPQPDVFTIYSKSGCTYCVKAKNLFLEKHVNFTMVDCDEFLLEDKLGFLEFIQSLTMKEHKTFPMIFKGDTFIGGFTELNDYFNKLLDFEMSF